MAPANPFPGMNPYMERRWGDVHASLILYARDALNDVLPGDLRARVEERVYLETDDGPDVPRRTVVPDVRVLELRGAAAAAGGGAAAVLERAAGDLDRVVLEYDDEPRTEGSIAIVDVRSGNRVVTLIEFVSPGNKGGGEGETKYRQKQRETLRAGANVVEIDLTRGGNHVLALPPERLPERYRAPYRACVTRGHRPNRAEWYPIPLRRRLPAVDVPLRPSDPDVRLDLQSLVDDAYRRGRYDDIDYRGDPDPPLAGDDAAWADEVLKAKGLR